MANACVGLTLVDVREVYPKIADQIEAHEVERITEPLDLCTAAAESGYTVEYLKQLMKCGRILNAGTNIRPLIRRCDLPKKGPPPARTAGLPDLVAMVRQNNPDDR
jgi:hypothetical protein